MRKIGIWVVAAVLGVTPAVAVDRAAVLATYADMAAAGFGDALIGGQRLQAAIEALIARPDSDRLAAARAAWRAARVPYQQTEVYRFGNPIVDAWEGRVNAWPLDEGLIDYVAGGGATDENAYAVLNVIANPAFALSGAQIDAETITPALLRDTLHEADTVEANVATGYHAIEFLLWGQDLNGTGLGPGDRPASDFDPAHCTGGHCARRIAYLRAATDLLLADLAEMAAAWAPGGAARVALAGMGEAGGITAMLTGMGSLSYGEQAGERMKLGLLLNDPEEEHDCFSDNTHNSHYYDGLGVRNVYLGRHVRIDGTVVSGASLSDLVAAADPGVDAGLRRALDRSMARLGDIKTVAEAGMAYDQMLAPGNAPGAALIEAAIAALIDQTREIERAVAALGVAQIVFEGSDALDRPQAVFQ